MVSVQSSLSGSHTTGSSPVVIRWTAIFAGAVAALGLVLMLYAFGLGTGFSAVNTDNGGRLEAVGIFSGAWGALAPFLALFVGGWIASYGSGANSRVVGFVHGLVVWAITNIAMVYVVAAMLGGLFGGAAAVTREVAQAGGQLVAGAVDSVGGAAKAGKALLGKAGDMADDIQLDPGKALETVNAQLKAHGKPQIRPEQIEAAGKDVVRKAMREGKLDRHALIDAISAHSTISHSDAEKVAAQLEGQFEEAKEKVQQEASRTKEMVQDKAQELQEEGKAYAKQGAQAVADGLGRFFSSLFVVMALGLIAAAGGGYAAGMVGADRADLR